MEKREYLEIKNLILQKKKQGKSREEIAKFLRLSGYPARLLDEVEEEFRKKHKENDNDEDSLVPKIIGVLFGVTALTELFYFFILVPQEKIVFLTHEFVTLIALTALTLVSFIFAFGLVMIKKWAFNNNSTLMFFRIIVLGGLFLIGYEFFIYIIILDLILLVILVLTIPTFKALNLKDTQFKMMEEIEKEKKYFYESKK